MTVVLCVAGGLLTKHEILSPIDALWYDSVIADQPLPVPDDIVLIAMEPDTLDRSNLNRRAWSRGDSAELLERLTLGEPAAVLLDVAMPLVDPLDPAGEARLSAAIKQSGNVVLPIYLQADRGDIRGFRLPIPKLANFSSALGHQKTVSAADGVTRRMPLAITNGDISWPHVVLPVLATAEKSIPYELPAEPVLHGSAGGWREAQYLYLRFIRPDAAFETYGARQVLNGEIDPERFRDKIVLIGSSVADANVVVPSSWRSGRTVWGLELSANAINTIRHQAWPIAVSPVVAGFIVAGLILITLLSFLILPDRSAFVATLAGVGAISLMSWALLSIWGVWFPHAAFAVTTALAYPLWAWRRLAATYRFVSIELNRMRAEPGVIGSGRAASENDAQPTLPPLTLIDQQLAAIQEATAKLRIARKFVSDTIEGLPIGVLVSDPHGSIVLANTRAYRIIDSLGDGVAPDAGALHGKDLSVVFDAFQGVDGSALRHTAWTMDHSREVVGPNGEKYWLACQQLTDESNNRLGAIVALTNISALREAEEQREELLRFLSHDMRSPLASIMALIELRTESAEQSNDNDRFEEIKRYARHTLSLAEEFLQLAYATTTNPGGFDIIDLAHAVETGIDLVRPLAREQRVRIDQKLSESATIRGDHNLIGRMVANLVHNAVKFTPAGGTISVSVERQQREWVCRVRDDGEGIAPDELPRLFQPYRRLRGDKRKGIGLGLSFVLVVVEKHGGTFEIFGEPGAGTDVVVRLPVLEETPLLRKDVTEESA